MDNERKDLEDICRFGSIELERRIELLTRYLDATKDCTVKGPHWLIAGALLWASVMQANSSMGTIRFHTRGLYDSSPKSLADGVKELYTMIPLIHLLQARLPDWMSKFDNIVTYGTCSERSWMMLAMSETVLFTVPGLKPNATGFENLGAAHEYDPHYVNLQLEIETEKFKRIRYCSTDNSAGGDTSPGTTIGESLNRILRGVQSEKQNLQLQKKVLPEYPGFTEAVNLLRARPKTKGHQAKICREVSNGDKKAAATLRTYLQNNRELWHEDFR